MNRTIRPAKRLEAIPAYIFSEINQIKEKAKAKGMDLISLAIGDPDKPTPTPIIDRMKAAVEKQSNHVYSPYEGTAEFREAAARWLKRRFGVAVDSSEELVALVGSKEGIAHFPLAYCDPGDVCLYPTPGFPMYSTTIALAGGKPVPLPLRYEKGFLPDLRELEALVEKTRPKYLTLNYPHNPTSAVCPKPLLADIVSLAKKHDVVIAYDNAYSEIYYDAKDRPASVLEIPGAKDVCIEFHTLSKTFNMTGWRIAFAAGNRDLVKALLKVKTNIDSGPVKSVQEAAAFALDNEEAISESMRKVYAERRKVALEGLDRLGIEYLEPRATFYVWAGVPQGGSSMEFAKRLIESQGVVVTPGVGFGPEGEHFFRLALTVDVPRLKEAIERMGKFLGR